MTSRYRQFIDYDTGGSERLYSHADICPGKPDCIHEEEEIMTETKPYVGCDCDFQANESQALIAALTEALETAMKTIRACNGLGVPKSQEPALWELYQASPEMKKINAALAKAKDHK